MHFAGDKYFDFTIVAIWLLCGERVHTDLSLLCGQGNGCVNGIGWSRPYDKLGKYMGVDISHTHDNLLNLGALEVSVVDNMFHL